MAKECIAIRAAGALQPRAKLVDLPDGLGLLVASDLAGSARPVALLLGGDVVAVLVAVDAELNELREHLGEVGEEQVTVVGVFVNPRAELGVVD